MKTPSSINPTPALNLERLLHKSIRAYLYSAGAVLLALATALLLANCLKGPLDLVPPRDAILGLSVRLLYWLLGAAFLLLAIYCLFGRNATAQLTNLLWLGVNVFACRLALPLVGAHGGFKGYLGGLADVFNVSTATVATLVAAAGWYALLGASASLAALWAHAWVRKAHPAIKMACAQCGGHIEFFPRNLGQQIPCPHCRTAVTLHGSAPLKMSCFFCKGHIEFPAHALGQKIHCPHCHKDITLLEPPAELASATPGSPTAHSTL